MAQMYPVQLDPATKSAAERRLFGLFQQQLGDEYHIFHSVKWIARDREGKPRDGEAGERFVSRRLLKAEAHACLGADDEAAICSNHLFTAMLRLTERFAWILQNASQSKRYSY